MSYNPACFSLKFPTPSFLRILGKLAWMPATDHDEIVFRLFLRLINSPILLILFFCCLCGLQNLLLWSYRCPFVCGYLAAREGNRSLNRYGISSDCLCFPQSRHSSVIFRAACFLSRGYSGSYSSRPRLTTTHRDHSFFLQLAQFSVFISLSADFVILLPFRVWFSLLSIPLLYIIGVMCQPPTPKRGKLIELFFGGICRFPPTENIHFVIVPNS